MVLASIPSPAGGIWQIGPVPIRAYALCIIAGVVAAVWIGDRRWVARGGTPGAVADVAIWAVPFGLVGGRLYHVATDWQLYFGDGRSPVHALYVWEGGLGVWGAIGFGAVGAWIGCRRLGIPFLMLADAVIPGVAVAQAIGRWGNWFNQELFGRPTTLPWGLEIDPEHRPAGYGGFTTFHPTFLYESLWCLGVALLVIWADRRYTLRHGRAVALYVMAYTVGRGWIEALRIDQAHHLGPLRLNDWTSIILFALALGYFVWASKYLPGQEASATDGTAADPSDGSGDSTVGAASAEATDSGDSAVSPPSRETTDQREDR